MIVKTLKTENGLTIGLTEEGRYFISSNKNIEKELIEYENFVYYPSIESNEGRHESIFLNKYVLEEEAFLIFDLVKSIYFEKGSLYLSLAFINEMFKIINMKIDLRKLIGSICELVFISEMRGEKIFISDFDAIDFKIDNDLYEIKSMIGNSNTFFITNQQLNIDCNIYLYNAKPAVNGYNIYSLLNENPNFAKRYKAFNNIMFKNFTFDIQLLKKVKSSELREKIIITSDNILKSFKLEVNYLMI